MAGSQIWAGMQRRSRAEASWENSAASPRASGGCLVRVARSSPILWARRGKWVTDAVMPLKRLTCGPGVLESTTVRNIRRFAKEAIDFMAELLEAIMLICFGLSWPLNAYKNYRAGTAVGTSWQFIALITAGYFAGIAAKFVSGNLNWVLIVYFINVVCIAANWLVYFRNRRLDAQRSTEVVMEEESFVVVA